ncbi:TatD DNase family protein [Cyclonatronum proteinivorum]|uniref:TatD DNase family protein n=1 Tax=Cyclonatronum proteinivorum TaxID=1457365 RepID=A0A345UJC2_9BACT|nr:TatD family hydrolase [Cyclonatronum proteinivorum]AXJ00574.1 TatD DNase family protein [Cyclonatronum proteinivorum]
MIDTHAHIYLPHFKDDLTETLDRAAEAGLTDILMPAIDFDSLPQMDRLSHARIRLHKMMGVHPCEINNSRCNLEASLLAACAANDIVAVGETGLDYYWSTEFVEEQKISLRRHCKVAKTLQKPIVLHNREATADLLDLIEEQQDGRLTGVWHCFTGTIEEGRRAIDLGLYLGIGGVATFKNGGLDKILPELPSERFILETDSPYLAPAPYRGKRNEPAYTALVATRLAALLDRSEADIIRITTENARRLFPRIIR